MRTIRISEEVWNEIAKRGVFGETPDDVLRRVFNLAEKNYNKQTSGWRRKQYATNRMSTGVNNEILYVRFADGSSNEWHLPDRHDKKALQAVRSQAVRFAEQHGATIGQVNAVKKALTDNGYHLTK
jgi:hypothetical protein